MFGHDWANAQATVVAIRDISSNWDWSSNTTFRSRFAHEYVVDRHDRGVLSDEEFAAAKAKAIAQG